MLLIAHELEDQDTDAIQAAIDEFRRRAGLLSSTVFLLGRRSRRPECIAECGDFPLALADDPFSARPQHGSLMDLTERFLLVWFYPPVATRDTIERLAREAAESIAAALDAFADRQARARFRRDRRSRRSA